VDLPVTGSVEMDEIFLVVSAPCLKRHGMVGMQVFSIE